MAEIIGSLQSTQQLNHTLESLFAALDPKAWILSQNSASLRSKPTDHPLKRGPRYKAYADLRESKLRMKNILNKQQSGEPESMMTPPKKRVTFRGTVSDSASNRTSVVAQSVPDFSAALRKENRRPGTTLPSLLEMTPPPSKASKTGAGSRLGGSKSVNAVEKRIGGVMARKSYASVEELKGLSAAAASAINGESRGGRSSRGINRTVLGYRQY